MSSFVGVEARMYFLPHVYDHPQPYMWPTLMSTKEETKAARSKKKAERIKAREAKLSWFYAVACRSTDANPNE